MNPGRQNQDRRLFDAFNLEGSGAGGPQKCGLSHDFQISALGTNAAGVIIKNDASNKDVQLVTFSADALVQGKPGSDVAPRTISCALFLKFGVGGTQHQAIINVKRGTIFTVGCSSYEVSGIVEGATEDDLDSVVRFRCSAAYGAHPGAKAPTRDFALSFSEGEGTVTIEIPAFARLCTIALSNPAGAAAGTVTALFRGDPADLAGQILYRNGDPDYNLRDMTFGFDHQFLVITKAAGAGVQRMLVQFELAF